MEVEAPGQLGGASTKGVMQRLIALRRRLVGALGTVEEPGCESLSLLFRVGGELHDYGDLVHPAEFDGRVVVCEIEVPPSDWAAMSDSEIDSVLEPCVASALRCCAAAAGWRLTTLDRALRVVRT